VVSGQIQTPKVTQSRKEHKEDALYHDPSAGDGGEEEQPRMGTDGDEESNAI